MEAKPLGFLVKSTKCDSFLLTLTERGMRCRNKEDLPQLDARGGCQALVRNGFQEMEDRFQNHSEGTCAAHLFQKVV